MLHPDMGIDRALVIVGSMGSFEPMDFWNFLNLTNHYPQKKELWVQNSQHVKIFMNFEPIN